ncbi:hypothetical protein [Mesorhizobium sp. M0227]|uniref:hypothetical protein n=1 Tax=unclassified Mesorhizobium TaxID=325217 RepID=UPI0033359A69
MNRSQIHDPIARRKLDHLADRLNEPNSHELNAAIDKTKKKIAAAFSDAKKVQATFKAAHSKGQPSG